MLLGWREAGRKFSVLGLYRVVSVGLVCYKFRHWIDATQLISHTEYSAYCLCILTHIFGLRITLITEFSSCEKVAISTNKCTLELIKGKFSALEHALKSGNKKNGCCLCGS
jgi:hypothetical protein